MDLDGLEKDNDVTLKKIPLDGSCYVQPMAKSWGQVPSSRAGVTFMWHSSVWEVILSSLSLTQPLTVVARACDSFPDILGGSPVVLYSPSLALAIGTLSLP